MMKNRWSAFCFIQMNLKQDQTGMLDLLKRPIIIRLPLLMAIQGKTLYILMLLPGGKVKLDASGSTDPDGKYGSQPEAQAAFAGMVTPLNS
jgi:hypothetical protein